jgi:hypothetical protein
MIDGTYIPTPIVYAGHLITVNNNGIVSAYNAETGQRAFRGRVGTRAEAGLTQVAANSMKEVIMATPAISDGLIVVRTIGHLYGIGE